MNDNWNQNTKTRRCHGTALQPDANCPKIPVPGIKSLTNLILDEAAMTDEEKIRTVIVVAVATAILPTLQHLHKCKVNCYKKPYTKNKLNNLVYDLHLTKVLFLSLWSVA